MEGFSRLLNYLGNVKAPIMSKIVWISLEKFLGLPARRAQACGNHRRFSRRAVLAVCTRTVLQLDEAARAFAQLNNGRLNCPWASRDARMFPLRS
ncbi:hypothetical protein [Bradyrhizobium sp. LM2.9]